MIFEKELATYRAALPNWVKEEGYWALILGDEIAGIFQGVRAGAR